MIDRKRLDAGIAVFNRWWIAGKLLEGLDDPGLDRDGENWALYEPTVRRMLAEIFEAMSAPVDGAEATMRRLRENLLKDRPI